MVPAAPDTGDGAQESAVDRVTAEVRRLVLNGTIAPGASFMMNDLASRLGVSHIPVREALRRLDEQGLIILRPGKSAMVSPLRIEELRSIYRLRRLLEPDLAARACVLLRQGDLARIAALLEQYADPGEDPDTLWQIHHDFHLALLEPVASTWDLRMLRQLWHASDRYTRMVFDTYDVADAERQRRYDAHLLLLRAAESAQPFEMRTALADHLNDNEARCLVGIARLDDGAAPPSRAT